MVDSLVSQAKPKMEAALQHFVSELKTVRTGRASATMLDSIIVPYFGNPTPLKALATVTTPDATQILIQPFDAGSIKDIVGAIRESGLGFNPSDDGRMIRITVPPLTSERREEMVKMVGKIAEATRIEIRQIRGKTWEDIQKAQKESLITVENREQGREEIDKITGEYNKKIETVVKEKEAEIRTV